MKYLDKTTGKIYNGKKELEGVVDNVQEYYHYTEIGGKLVAKRVFRVTKYEYHKPIPKITKNEEDYLAGSTPGRKTTFIRTGLTPGIYSGEQLRNWHINGIASEPIVMAADYYAA